jgi:hypothetical protein
VFDCSNNSAGSLLAIVAAPTPALTGAVSSSPRRMTFV